MTNAYIDPVVYLRTPTGQETATLLGNVVRLTGATLVGATTLPITPLTGSALQAGDIVTIFDFGNSETVIVGAFTPKGATSIPVSGGTLFAHGATVVVASDGGYGSLAQTILDACAELEDICHQPLALGTYTDTHDLQSMRASITQDGQLVVRPYVAPVQSVTSIAATYTNYSAVPVQYDLSSAKITNHGKIVELLGLATSGNEQGYPVYPVLPSMNGYSPTGTLDITYTAGYTQAAFPGALREAAILLVSDLLSQRLNPAGYASSAMSKTRTDAVLRGDLSGESLLYKRAVKKATPYIQKAY